MSGLNFIEKLKESLVKTPVKGAEESKPGDN
jgi:hypothetical protein